MTNSHKKTSFARIIILAVVALASLWAVGALYYDVPIPSMRIVFVCLYLGVLAAIAWLTRFNRAGLLLWLGTLILIIAWWFSLRPSSTRPWQADVLELPEVSRNGGSITIHNVRDFSYRTETDYTPHWITRQVDLSKMQGVDLFLIHFGSKLIAHAIVSFHFKDETGNDTFIAMSIEQRKVVGQTYSTVRGFYRQYELIYLAADERDVVKLRTNYRTGEYVRLYHTLTTPDDSRKLFLQYVKWFEDQRRQPQWYNALTDNCTTNVTTYLSRNHVGGLSPWDWRNILNGFGDRMLYDDGDLATGGLSFDELSKQAEINDAAKALGDDPNFSIDIRRGHPGF